MRCTIREQRYWDGRMESNDKERCAQWVRNGRKRNLHSSKNDGHKRKSQQNNRRKAQPHPDDDEQLQDGEEQSRAPHNHADSAWRHRACVEIVPGKIEAIAMKREVKSELSPSAYAPIHSSDVHPASDGQGRGKTRSIQRERMRARQRKCHSSALSQQDQKSDECSVRSILHQTRRARAQIPNGMPAPRVEHVKEGWGDVRASKGKRGNATHALRVHSSYMYGPGRREERSRRERIGGAVVFEYKPRVVVLVVLRLGFGRAFLRSGAMLVGLCSAWCALRSWVVMMEEDMALEAAQGPRPKRQGKEQGGVGMGGRKSGAWGAQMRRSRVKVQGVSNGGKARWVCAEEQGETRGRMDDEGQDYEGKLEVAGGGGRAHSRVASRTGNGGRSPWCERAKEEVELLEMKKRAACWEAQGVACADRAHPFSPGYARSLGIKGAICIPVHADERISVGAGMKRRVYTAGGPEAVRGRGSGVCAGHAPRRTGCTEHHGLWRGRGWEGAPNLSEVLARRFERHGSRIDRCVSGLRNEKIRRCTASSVGGA
ncbi:hypothetical protein K438DRAFT_1777163 [Mycena galopus ATCC 62051]|nr:hypothetical protein K438DRAFT_1777163 [Mycena galopus ATCC 62051]